MRFKRSRRVGGSPSRARQAAMHHFKAGGPGWSVWRSAPQSSMSILFAPDRSAYVGKPAWDGTRGAGEHDMSMKIDFGAPGWQDRHTNRYIDTDGAEGHLVDFTPG